MKRRAFIASVIAPAFFLSACATGTLLVEPLVTETDILQARLDLWTHHIEPSRDLDNVDMHATLLPIWESMKAPILETCMEVFTSNCDVSVSTMNLLLVPDNSINAYANAETFTIGIHAGLMRSAGSDDEIAWVLGHEAAHLMFFHSQKKYQNAMNTALLHGAMMTGLGLAMQQGGMYTGHVADAIPEVMAAGFDIGRTAYSPEMEIEADQFAAYAMKRSGRPMGAILDTIVRLQRGEVPAPVRQGDGWAGYLTTHPADDYRLAAMQRTIAGHRKWIPSAWRQTTVMRPNRREYWLH